MRILRSWCERRSNQPFGKLRETLGNKPGAAKLADHAQREEVEDEPAEHIILGASRPVDLFTKQAAFFDGVRIFIPKTFEEFRLHLQKFERSRGLRCTWKDKRHPAKCCFTRLYQAKPSGIY